MKQRQTFPTSLTAVAAPQPSCVLHEQPRPYEKNGKLSSAQYRHHPQPPTQYEPYHHRHNHYQDKRCLSNPVRILFLIARPGMHTPAYIFYVPSSADAFSNTYCYRCWSPPCIYRHPRTCAELVTYNLNTHSTGSSSLPHTRPSSRRSLPSSPPATHPHPCFPRVS